MAKCTACKKQFPAPFWKLTTICPECAASQADFRAQLLRLTPQFFVTPALVGVNALVFVLMVISGVSFTDPTIAQLQHWGANFGPLTLGAEPWRLVTCMFVHIGFIHLAFNMWCLWSLGSLGERLLGNWNFLWLYLLSGVGGSLLSLAIHPMQVSAGASGAIFGVAGGLIALLALKKVSIPGAAVKQNLKSLLAFIGYNLLYGMRGGVDNAAHLGGMLAGAMIGAFIPRRSVSAETTSLSSEESPVANYVMVGATCLLLLGYSAERRMQSPMVVVAQAEKLVEAGQTDAAIAILKSAAAQNPRLVQVHIMLGRAYLKKRQFDDALSSFATAVSLNPADPTALGFRGVAFLAKREYDRAIQDFGEAIRINPEYAWAVARRGSAYEAKGEYSSAIQDYDAALRLMPNDAWALAQRGYCHLNSGESEKAIQDLNRAIELHPNSAWERSTRGRAEFVQGQYAAAAPDFEKAVQLEPTHAYYVIWNYLAESRGGHEGRSVLLAGSKKLDLNLWPGPVLQFLLGTRSEESLFKAAADPNPNKQREQLCEAHFYFAEYEMTLGLMKAAIPELKTAANMCPVDFIEFSAANAELRHMRQ